MSTGYGNVMPFYDVLLGTIPFEVKYSVPFPFIDFITHPASVWSTYVDPREVRWTLLQKLWYGAWLLWICFVTVITFGVYWAPWGSCYPDAWPQVPAWRGLTLPESTMPPAVDHRSVVWGTSVGMAL